MENVIVFRIVGVVLGSAICLLLIRYLRQGFYLNMVWIGTITALSYGLFGFLGMVSAIFYMLLPICFLNLLIFVYVPYNKEGQGKDQKYRVDFKTRGKRLILENIRRGISIIGSAGSGKTESITYNLLEHFKEYKFSGVIHDYKNFEITEMAQPVFDKSKIPFHIISFGPIYGKVNPIAPRYIKDVEDVHEIARVLFENLLEMRESGSTGSSKFFNDAAQGLIAGMIWRLKTDFGDYCTVPHLIALYQKLTTKGLVNFLKGNLQSKSMADAFIRGTGSDRQTAGVLSTLSNAFTKISSPNIFMVLSEDQVKLDINTGRNLGVISIVNDPKRETSLSPIIATIIHTVTKQMSIRDSNHSFLLMEEAPTLRLLNMHRIPATLRSYDITTVYVMQDKIQNDMMYGERASRAILSNLSYQFFGKANDPDTAKYYERFFEVVKKPTRSVNHGYGLDFDTRVTQGEKEVAKTRADVFYGLRQGEFIVLHDGQDKKVRFTAPKMKKVLGKPKEITEDEMLKHFDKVHRDVKSIFEVNDGAENGVTD